MRPHIAVELDAVTMSVSDETTVNPE